MFYALKHIALSQAWWYVSVVPGPEWLRQEDGHKFKAGINYIVISWPA